jgi:glycosyltransferase involved in cell wall biosynthesis
MRIGIDARLMNETGVGRYIRNLISELKKIDKKNEYIIFRNNIPWHSFAEQIRMPLLYYRAHLDLLHVPYFNVPFLYFKKFIVTIHDLTILHFDTGKASTLPYVMYKLKRFAYYLLLLKAIHWSEKIIAVSHTTKQEILDHFDVLPEHIEVIYEG